MILVTGARSASRRKPRRGKLPQCARGARWIRLTQGKFALVDARDFKRVSTHSWSVTNGYASTHIGTPVVLMHRFVLGLGPGRVPEVDHKNLDRLDNRRRNLRLATSRQNKLNAPKRRGQTTSRFKGVVWHRQRQKWMAQACHRYLGLFDCEEDAARAYNREVLRCDKRFSRPNLIQTVP